jgi:hypothetical protein
MCIQTLLKKFIYQKGRPRAIKERIYKFSTKKITLSASWGTLFVVVIGVILLRIPMLKAYSSVIGWTVAAIVFFTPGLVGLVWIIRKEALSRTLVPYYGAEAVFNGFGLLFISWILPACLLVSKLLVK